MTDDGEEIDGNSVQGLLALKSSWPGQMRTIYGDHKDFLILIFPNLVDIILPEMAQEEMRMGIIGLLAGLMMY